MFNITKSKSDKRVYLYNRLPNLLKYLIVHDPDADKSAAAMNVNVGSLLDPSNFPGLAHFLEHMLFMGTKKYPEENDFADFLNKNAGYSNAYTDLDCTNYYFEVSNEKFDSALDRFSEFFTNPLFNESAVEREVQAVDSEHKKNIQSDLWRMMQLIRSESNQNSIFNRFATGSLDTLNKPLLRDALVDFHKKYYSSHLMSLVIVSNQKVEDLSKLVENLFSNVRLNNDMDKYLKYPVLETHFNFIDTKKLSEVPAYDADECGYLYHVVPVKDLDQIFIYWFFDENMNLTYKKKLLDYVSSVLGHEGPFSLTSSLVKDDLISQLSSGGYTQANTLTTFYFKIHLTKKGLKDPDIVIQRVFEALQMMKDQPINKRYFEELKNIVSLKFDYKEKEDPTDYCSDLACRFINKPPEDILCGDYTCFDYDEKFLKDSINKFDIKNCNIYMLSRSYESKANLAEKWYGTKYSKEKFSQNIIDAYHGKFERKHKHMLSYPPENKFIATTFDIKPQENKEENFPVLLDRNDTRDIWFKQDNIFLLPKAIIYLQIYLKRDILPAADYAIISNIMNNIFENELLEISYMAKEASMSINFYFNLEGMIITIEGFDSALKSSTLEIITKFKETVDRLNQRFKNYYNYINSLIHGFDKKDYDKAEKDDFIELLDKIKTKIEESEQENSNFFLSNPYTQTLSNLDIFIRANSVDHETKLKSINRLKDLAFDEKNFHAFSLFLDSFLIESKYEWLIQGNITKNEALDIVNSTQDILIKNVLATKDIPPIKIANIGKKQNFYFNFLSKDEKNLNSSLISYFQAGNLEDNDYCKLLILEALFREKFFDDLRTKRALGYIVRLGLREHRDVKGVFCLVQSSQRSPEYLHDVINQFLENPEFDKIDDETYQEYVKSVTDELNKKDLKLDEEALRNFTEIKNKNYKFDKRRIYVDLLKNIKIEEVKELYNKIFKLEMKRLDVGLLAHCHLEENNNYENENNKKMEEREVQRIKVESANEFKRIISLYPDFFHKTVKNYPKF